MEVPCARVVGGIASTRVGDEAGTKEWRHAGGDTKRREGLANIGEDTSREERWRRHIGSLCHCAAGLGGDAGESVYISWVVSDAMD